MPIISVIVPVYKVENFIDRCVQSILSQTYTDYELILVDDGSPDKCGAICEAWAEKDHRIRVIHKENGGLSDARNVGVKCSVGEWITFIDSDDYVHPKMLESLYNAVLEHGVKVSICGYAYTYGEPLEVTDLTAKAWKPADFYLQHNVNATVSWGKLYHKDVVISFPVGKLHEDEYTTYRVLFGCNKLAVVEAPLYAYFQNASGIMNSKWHVNRMDAWTALEQQVAFFLEIGDTANARARVSAWWANVCRQMDAIKKDCSRDECTRYISLCRAQLQRILKEYRALMGYNLLDHEAMYITAWPRRKVFIRGYCKVKVVLNRVIVSFLGQDRLERIKKRIGFQEKEKKDANQCHRSGV